MPQIFHRSANTLSKVSIVGGLLLAGGLIGLIMVLGRSSYVTRANEYIEQPIQFSHLHHVGDDGIDCRYCHTSIETSSFAGVELVKTGERYELASTQELAGISTPLVLSVHSVVSFDFAVSMLPGWHATIFPPYFVAGAIYSGFAMVMTLAVPLRKFYGLEDFITIRRLTLVSVRGYDRGLNRREFVVPCDEFLGGGWIWHHGSIAASRPGLLSSSAPES